MLGPVVIDGRLGQGARAVAEWSIPVSFRNMRAEEPPTDPLLRVQQLHKQYGAQSVLNGVSLKLERGQRIALMGPSGSGKSTLLNCLAGLEIPDSGTISFLGNDFARLSEGQKTQLRRRSIASIFQFFHLLPTLRAAENVEFPLLLIGEQAATRARRVESMLAEVGLQHRRMAWPSELSGGELQRLAIARALITEPAMILADEPTGSLDSRNGRSVLDLLKRLTEHHKTALLMVTHDHQAARICDRILEIRDGILKSTD